MNASPRNWKWCWTRRNTKSSSPRRPPRKTLPIPPRRRSPRRMRYLASALLFLSLAASLPVRGAQLGDLPGEDVSSSGGEVEKSQSKVTPTATQARRAENWLAPGVNEQLSRDRILIPLGKGALFVPTYSEPRREPEVSAIDARGKLARTGQTGERILLDSG